MLQPVHGFVDFNQQHLVYSRYWKVTVNTGFHKNMFAKAHTLRQTFAFCCD